MAKKSCCAGKNCPCRGCCVCLCTKKLKPQAVHLIKELAKQLSK